MSDPREHGRSAVVIPDRPLALWAWILMLLPALLATARLAWVIPKFGATIGGYDGHLPLLTQWLGAAPWIVFAWPLAVAALAYSQRRRHSRWLALLVASVVGSLLVFALALLVLYLPYFKLAGPT